MVVELRRVWHYLQWLYFQYCIHLGVNTFEPWEVRIFNSLIVLMISCTIYTTYLFMPGHLHMWMNVFRWASAAVVESVFGSQLASNATASSYSSRGSFPGGSSLTGSDG
jgi:hypothetical protein